MIVDREYEGGIDLGTITHVCVCGSELWNLQVMFDDYEISMYFTEMECAVCGNKAIAPTPVDRPDYIWSNDHEHSY